MTSIQAVYIRGHEDRAQPKPHVVYHIEIQAGVRSWQIWRRYSEFVDLHTELTKSTGAAPPAPVPPKHSFSMFRSRDDPKLIEERRVGLEAYLRAIVSAKDERWRDTFAFRDFLGVPIGKAGGVGVAEGGSGYTSSSWLDEHVDLQARIRDIRADVNRRDALSSGNDVGGAHSANVQAKKKLAGVLSSVGALERGLDELAMGGMAEGELRRRKDMAANLRDDCEKLAKIVTAARHTTMATNSTMTATSTDRQSLLQTGSAFAAKPARVFGAPQAVETEETRPLDDQGLLQLQQHRMEQQDLSLDQLSTILGRQKQIGVAIHNEVSQQIEMLDDLNNEVDRVGNNLGKTKTQLNRLK